LAGVARICAIRIADPDREGSAFPAVLVHVGVGVVVDIALLVAVFALSQGVAISGTIIILPFLELVEELVPGDFYNGSMFRLRSLREHDADGADIAGVVLLGTPAGSREAGGWVLG
jgi:hypothetical protein